VTITVPNAGNVKLQLDENTTFKDLLPEIANSVAAGGQKLR
jgi:uncharacterized repeat protein (TIGR01451 family)